MKSHSAIKIHAFKWIAIFFILQIVWSNSPNAPIDWETKIVEDQKIQFKNDIFSVNSYYAHFPSGDSLIIKMAIENSSGSIFIAHAYPFDSTMFYLCGKEKKDYCFDGEIYLNYSIVIYQGEAQAIIWDSDICPCATGYSSFYLTFLDSRDLKSKFGSLSLNFTGHLEFSRAINKEEILVGIQNIQRWNTTLTEIVFKRDTLFYINSNFENGLRYENVVDRQYELDFKPTEMELFSNMKLSQKYTLSVSPSDIINVKRLYFKSQEIKIPKQYRGKYNYYELPTYEKPKLIQIEINNKQYFLKEHNDLRKLGYFWPG